MYRFVEHTGEVEIAIATTTEAGVFEEALMAVTLNSIEVRQEDGTWHGRVVLDV